MPAKGQGRFSTAPCGSGRRNVMPIDESMPRLVARLPNGQQLVPCAPDRGRETAACAGPDQWGYCPAMIAGETPICREAIWVLHSVSGRSWNFRFGSEFDVCPVKLLLGRTE
jgi:hypothetical protein